MDEFKYLLDGEAVSARMLINEAELYSDEFASSGFKLTSEAADILRKNGFVVRENPAY